MWPSIPLVVPQATLGTAMGFATSVQMIGIGISNLVVGQILGTKSRWHKGPTYIFITHWNLIQYMFIHAHDIISQKSPHIMFFLTASWYSLKYHVNELVCVVCVLCSDEKIPLWRWQYMMIFMLANTISCIVTSIILNIVDYRQVQ